MISCACPIEEGGAFVYIDHVMQPIINYTWRYTLTCMPARLVAGADDAAVAAARIGSEVALKINPPDLLHNSDIGGVRRRVSGSGVRAAYEAAAAAVSARTSGRLAGVIVSPRLNLSRPEHGHSRKRVQA